MTERLVSKLHVALLSYDEREIRVRKNYLEEQNPAICCVCFHSGEELLRELRQERSVDIVVLSSQLEDMDGYEFLKRLNSLHNRPLLLLQGDDWYSDATASFLRPDGRQYLPERSSLLDLLLDLRSSTDIGIFWVLPFCKQLYAEWGIQQPDVNCEYLTTALQVVCGTERKLAVRKEILQTVAEEHHTTVAAVDCGMRRLIDGVQAGLLLCRRYCAHMGWVLSLTPRDAGSGTRAEVRIPLAGTMFPIEGSVELHTIHPALTTADGLRWQILRELALLSDKME